MPQLKFVLRIFVFLFAVYPSAARSQLLDYNPYGGYSLKTGILGNDYGNPLPACITGNAKSTPASTARVRVSIAYQAHEYKAAFHIDHKAEASILGIGGGGQELHIGRDTQRAGSAFDIIIEATSEYPTQTIDNVKWDPPYDASMQTKDPQRIQSVRMICGDRFVRSVFNEVRLFAVLRVSSQQQSTLSSFSGKVNGSLNLEVVSASAMLGGDVNVSSAHQAGAVTIEIFSQGLGGLVPTLGAIGITTADGLASIATKLVTYKDTLKATGQPVKYRLSPLPGMPTGSLEDDRIFEKLAEMKEKYLGFKDNLANAQSLLGPDPRRMVLKQPKADNLLRNQVSILSAYVDRVAEAHEACRRAATIAVCTGLERKLEPLPEQSIVDLPPIVPISAGRYNIAINGLTITPGQNDIMFSKGTILESAMLIDSAVKNVDVFVPIFSAYVSHVDILVQEFAKGQVIGVGRLLAGDLAWPAYFPFKQGPPGDAIFFITPILVAHADPRNPCRLSYLKYLNVNFRVIDPTCLTAAGRVFRDVALTQLAIAVDQFNGAAQEISVPLGVGVQSCFAPPTPVYPSNALDISVFPGAQGGITGRVVVRPQTPHGTPFILVREEETHELQAWRGLAQERLAQLGALRGVASGANPCSPRIPKD